jgi:hypothetical protein
MHPYLRETIDRFVDHFAGDVRCVGLHLKGSGGTGTDDAYSDVDLELVVEDAAYAAVSSELRAICERVCGRIQLWFPEGVRADSCNYAFLFEHDGEQFLYDFAIATRSAVEALGTRRPGRVLVDHDAWLESLRAERRPAAFLPAQLPNTIEHYWLYAYLSGKYTRRGDLPKLLYIQQTIFRDHLTIQRALHPEHSSIDWGWWPRDLARLTPDTQAELLRYFAPPQLGALRTALGDELASFADDARAACVRWNHPYPADLEAYVRRHLLAMDAIPATSATSDTSATIDLARSQQPSS